jgi:hypothetical protein
MKLKVYVVDVDLSARQKKIVRAAVVTGAVVAALGIGLAIAAPHQWSTNDPLKATDLNGLNVVSYKPDHDKRRHFLCRIHGVCRRKEDVRDRYRLFGDGAHVLG